MTVTATAGELAILSVVVVSVLVLPVLLISLTGLFTDLFSNSKANTLHMKKWDAYNGMLQPKCESSVYLAK